MSTRRSNRSRGAAAGAAVNLPDRFHGQPVRARFEPSVDGRRAHGPIQRQVDPNHGERQSTKSGAVEFGAGAEATRLSRPDSGDTELESNAVLRLTDRVPVVGGFGLSTADLQIREVLRHPLCHLHIGHAHRQLPPSILSTLLKADGRDGFTALTSLRRFAAGREEVKGEAS